MSACGAVSPKTRAVCDLEGAHENHLGVYRDETGRRCQDLWPNEEFVVPSAPITSSDPDKRLREKAGLIPGVPQEASEAWNKGPWVNQTFETFKEFLRGRSEPFTTAEDFWPLIDNVPERRAMVEVVKKAKWASLIVEVGTRDLKGVFHTRDGVEFLMNKKVPLYRASL